MFKESNKLMCVDLCLFSKQRSTDRAAKESEELLSTLESMASVVHTMRQSMPAIIIPANRDMIDSLLCIICKSEILVMKLINI